MALVTQAEYARYRQISREAARKRTTTAGGPIPVHGPKRLVGVDEADTLWEVTKTAPVDHRTYQEARTAKMVSRGNLHLLFSGPGISHGRSWSTTPTGIRSSFTRRPESRCGIPLVSVDPH